MKTKCRVCGEEFDPVGADDGDTFPGAHHEATCGKVGAGLRFVGCASCAREWAKDLQLSRVDWEIVSWGAVGSMAFCNTCPPGVEPKHVSREIVARPRGNR